MNDNAPVFQVEHINFSYNQQIALKDINLTVREGELIAILGANGSGKSTLLKILDALYFPTSGAVRAFGELLTEAAMQDDARAFAFRRRVGLVFQDPDVQLFSPTVWDEVTFAPLHLGLPRAEVIERAEWAMDLLSIHKLRDRAPHRLSGGKRKKSRSRRCCRCAPTCGCSTSQPRHSTRAARAACWTLSVS